MESLTMMEIKADLYWVWLSEEANCVTLEGILRLNGGEEYAPIAQILDSAATQGDSMVIDIQDLSFLNSSGIHMLSKFVIQQRKQENLQIKVIGSRRVPWHEKSLQSLKRLLPKLEIELR
jgi:hypothetical protein